MAKITLVLGGARSGKSTYALKLAQSQKKVAFIATCQALDKEMANRIELHKESRPKHWQTFEEPRDLEKALGRIGDEFDCIIIDCLTLLVSNLFLSDKKEEQIIAKFREFLKQVEKKNAKVIMVSNELGLGIVPANKLGREFRDIAGRLNQLAAQEADDVFFMTAGLPLKIK